MSALDGKVVLITGASSGIGRSAATAFADAGARLVLAARRQELGEAVAEEIRAKGSEAIFVRTDVSRGSEVESLVAATVARFGRLDAAFNNAAGLDGALATTADFTEEAFDRTIAGTLKSVWLCLKYEIRQMLAQSPAGGAIVNTSSVNGLGGSNGGALYSAAKAGVLALTKCSAQEYARSGIRVNALVAGGFRTPMLEHVIEHYGAAMPGGTAAVEAAYHQLVPMGRIGRPEEAAAAAVWLCSDEASYVTGHSMIVDGGMTAPFR
jgi:NAD(P)-dependent dehydrogenase (short-subunit alcohol dehydrogenase family)